MALKAKKLYHIFKKREQRNIANCRKKIRHPSPEFAMAAAMSSKEHNNFEHPLYYYKCNVCDGYHVTKQFSNSTTFVV